LKKFLTYTVLILIFFVVGIFIANFIIMPSFVRSGKEVTVPNVCALPLDSAIAVLKKNKLQGVVVERRYDKIIDEGKVIIQEPLPNVKVKRNRIINLSISLGPETVKIPFLYGLDLEKGRMIFEKLGLIVEEIDSAYSDSIGRGKIIRTYPDFDSEIVKGGSIRILYSRGIRLKMPNLVGLPLPQARDTIAKLGLAIREVKEIEGSAAKNTVMVQNPEPDKVLNPGDSVNLIVVK
jgi:beta-lactam-binding protein with PASTA domain